MSPQKSNIFIAAIITLCVSLLSLHAEPSKKHDTSMHAHAQLKKIIIPVVDFERLTLREALESVTIKIRQLPDKKGSNFMIRDLDGHFENYRVTLQLSNIPADVLLEYIANQVRANIQYTGHAIVFSPLPTPGK
jgi:hypothetical protein